MSDTEQKTYERVADVLIQELDLVGIPGRDDRLVEDLNADSLDMVEVAMAIEEVFEREISDDELSGWTTVGDIVATVGGDE
jgi:acyl carrier protein